MTNKERLKTVFGGRKPDRPPVLGGWIANPGMLLKITGESAEAYHEDPKRVAIKAYHELGMDGIIGVFTTRDVDIYRCVDQDSYITADKGMTYEQAEQAAEELPSAADFQRHFDFDEKYAQFKHDFLTMQADCGDMLYVPANWGAGARASWYGDFGYENFFLLIGLRPDLGIKLFQLGGAMGRCQSNMIARAINEGIYPKAVLLGEDICTQRGPMISVDFMEEHYAPALAYGLEPLLDAGCRPVWHCDGDVRPLLPLLLRSGVQGFQGFQPECGMLIEELAGLRARDGGKLLFFGPFAVTTELPVWKPERIRARVREVVELCRDKADLVFFTANTINPDIPLDNLLAMYDEIKKINYM
jgi:hypothetical protein